MNNESFLIEKMDLEIVRNVCRAIDNEGIKNRAVSNVISASLAKKYFNDYDVDTESGIYNVCQVLENIEISDIYINDNYIDARLYLDENGIFVPKSHFDNGLLPIAYMFIKVDSELTNGLVTGFILPSEINTSNDIGGYYKVEESELVSFYDIESSIISKDNEAIPDVFEIQIHNYLDGKMDNPVDFYRTLLESKECRYKLKAAAKAKTIFEFISIPETEIIEKPINIEEELVVKELVLSKNEDLPEFENHETIENTLEEEELLIAESEELLEDDSLETIDANEFENPSFDIKEASINEFESFEDVEELSLATDDLLDNSQDFQEIGLSESLEEMEPMGLEDDSQLLEINSNEDSFPLDDGELSYGSDPQTEETNNEEIIEEAEAAFIEPDFSEIKMVDYSNYEEPKISMSNIEEKPNNEHRFVSLNNEELSNVQNEPEVLEPEIMEENIQELPIKEDEEEDFSEILSIEEEVITDTNEHEEVSVFEYSTNITPSLDSLEQENVMELTEEMLNEEASGEPEPVNETEKSEEIVALFDSEQQEELSENINEEIIPTVQNKKLNSALLPILIAIVIVACIGYYGYTKIFGNSVSENNDSLESASSLVQPNKNNTAEPSNEAMPVETVENIDLNLTTKESNYTTIPAIEHNLDASIAISNLSVQISVPAGYRSSKTAERYWAKMGKILQLNLKTELLLLTKQPITNKIEVELEFDKNAQKFIVKGIKASSGEKLIDNVILQTIENTLNTNLSINMSAFGNIPGNPVLIINL